MRTVSVLLSARDCTVYSNNTGCRFIKLFTVHSVSSGRWPATGHLLAMLSWCYIYICL